MFLVIQNGNVLSVPLDTPSGFSCIRCGYETLHRSPHSIVRMHWIDLIFDCNRFGNLSFKLTTNIKHTYYYIWETWNAQTTQNYCCCRCYGCCHKCNLISFDNIFNSSFRNMHKGSNMHSIWADFGIGMHLPLFPPTNANFSLKVSCACHMLLAVRKLSDVNVIVHFIFYVSNCSPKFPFKIFLLIRSSPMHKRMHLCVGVRVYLCMLQSIPLNGH